MTRYVYDYTEGGDAGRELLGGKGAGLAEMTALGVPVPGGFVVSTQACVEYMRAGREPDGLAEQVDEAIGRLEEAT
ncbi:MAG TPA: PEP/pyruvate-binding domain-containing protein, partial [Gaiellaceae bacterium]|nr:PEP/pyruvate-binding domain-containing protein [Gaiellaceae bacterium]